MSAVFIHKTDKLCKAIVMIMLMIVCAKSYAQTPHTIDSLYTELAKATTPADSVEILYNLYDCHYFEERTPLLNQIYETAERAKDYDSMLETLIVLTAIYLPYPDYEEVLIKMAQRAPESEIQKAYLLYIKLRYQTSNLNLASEAERHQKLHQALKEYSSNDSVDKYDQIAYLFLICTNLRNSADSKLLVDYLQQLQELVEDLPEKELAVRSQFYTLSISAYVENEMFDKALEANKRMLEIIGMFDKRHEAQGRKFRSYDGSLYKCSEDMLICGQLLTDEEIEKHYRLTREIIARNPRMRQDTEWQTATRIHYLMAKKHYAEAIPLLKAVLRANTIKAHQYQYTKLLIKAAKAVGDKEALLEGSKILNSIYSERLNAKSDVRLSELQTIYDVGSLTDKNRNLNSENQRMEIDRRRQAVIAVTVAAVIVVCLLIWLISLYLRSRKLARRLSASNKEFIDERNSHSEIFARLVKMRDKAKVADVTKSNFVKDMSSEIKEPLDAIVEYSRLIADYAKADDRPYIREYAEAMSVNTDLLIRLGNDILDLPEIESGQLSIQPTYSSVKDICNFALEVIKKHVSPGVDVIFTNNGHLDSIIYTDAQRVEQVLIQVLTNAAKFTEIGSITFSYEIDQVNEKINFTVTDTGIGIPQGMEEKIFNRFVKMDPTSQGSGLGLYIGRLLANMLGGTLSLDSNYTGGARFIFTIPINKVD